MTAASRLFPRPAPTLRRPVVLVDVDDVLCRLDCEHLQDAGPLGNDIRRQIDSLNRLCGLLVEQDLAHGA